MSVSAVIPHSLLLILFFKIHSPTVNTGLKFSIISNNMDHEHLTV